MADDNSFSKFVPGFDFLQGLVKNAGASLPSMGQWVAPTLDPGELDKRITELRIVQFWLEQNVRMLDSSIKALEVQRMTLATLKSMNVPMADLRESLKVKPDTAAAASPGAVDPMQWWNALTQQFGQLAAEVGKPAASAPAGKKPARKSSAHKPARGT